MDALTDLQRFRIDEHCLVRAANCAALRWRIKINPSMKQYDPALPGAVIILNLTVHNYGQDADAVIKIQHSDADVAINAPPYPGTFEATFTDLSAVKTIKPMTAQEIEVRITKPYVQIYGLGPAQLRIQGYCTAPIDLIGINDGSLI